MSQLSRFQVFVQDERPNLVSSPQTLRGADRAARAWSRREPETGVTVHVAGSSKVLALYVGGHCLTLGGL